jgi:hypothetical protein
VKLAVSMKGTLNIADQDQGWNLEVSIPWRSFADLADNPVPKPFFAFVCGEPPKAETLRIRG